MRKYDFGDLTITLNHGAKTATIRKYDNGKMYAKYRTIRMDYEDWHYYSEYATRRDWEQFMKSSDYYRIY